jgi:hypothetical protein
MDVVRHYCKVVEFVMCGVAVADCFDYHGSDRGLAQILGAMGCVVEDTVNGQESSAGAAGLGEGAV